MFDPRWGDGRDRDGRDDGRERVYGDRDRDSHDPRDGLMRDLDLPSGQERALVVHRDRGYELNGEDSRQYCAFTGTARGQNSREFVARLVARGFVRVIEPGPVRRGRLGVAYDGKRFNRTAVTAPLFRYLAPVERAQEGLASPTGFEPVF